MVGGHCIGVDPYYLTYKAQELGYHAQVINSGRYVNDSMGFYVTKQTIKKLISLGKDISKARVLVMGATFKEDVEDIRNSKVADVINEFKSYGIKTDIIDPNADALGGTVDCISGQLDLTGISSTAGTTFSWIGPNNFNSALQNPTVSNPGLYILTVTGPNGCTALANATVAENTDSPVVTIGGAGTLTCDATDLTLVSNIQTAGALMSKIDKLIAVGVFFCSNCFL